MLEQDWATLGPKLRGKLHIWVGEADDYFLNNAVHLLDDFLAEAHPAFEGKITYAMGKNHFWRGLTTRQMMDEMAAQVEKGRKEKETPAAESRLIHALDGTVWFCGGKFPSCRRRQVGNLPPQQPDGLNEFVYQDAVCFGSSSGESKNSSMDSGSRAGRRRR